MYPGFFRFALRGEDPEVDAYVLKRATSAAISLVTTHGLSVNDFDDIRQELILEVIRRTKYFNPGRCQWHTFVSRVVRNRAFELLDGHRKGPHEIREADLPESEFENSPGPDSFAHIQVKIDNAKILSRVPARLRELCHQLREQTVSEVAASAGKTRGRIYQLTAQLRAEFERRGYSRPRPLRRAG
jgi:RNA polymerase sigma factor (sigma-70 family)